MKAVVTRDSFVAGVLAAKGDIIEGPGARELVAANKATEIEAMVEEAAKEMTAPEKTKSLDGAKPAAKKTEYTSPSGKKVGVTKKTGKRGRPRRNT